MAYTQQTDQGLIGNKLKRADILEEMLRTRTEHFITYLRGKHNAGSHLLKKQPKFYSDRPPLVVTMVTSDC